MKEPLHRSRPEFPGGTVAMHDEIPSIRLESRRPVAKVEVKNQDDALGAVADHILLWVPNG